MDLHTFIRWDWSNCNEIMATASKGKFLFIKKLLYFFFVLLFLCILDISKILEAN